MPWIPIILPDAANAPLTEAYGIVAGKRGTVANILGVHSVHPEVMLSHLRLYQDVMFARSQLTRAEREMVAVVVSRTNACVY